MESLIDLLIIIIFYTLIIPACVLLHELGHAFGVVLFSKKRATVYLGHNRKGKETFRVGRISFCIKWSSVGFCGWEHKEASVFQRVMVFGGGPLVSFVLFSLFFILTFHHTLHEDFNLLCNGIWIFNLINFAVTAFPFIYPKWWGPYAGLPSDGYQIYQTLKRAEPIQ
ncbi:site-2 protease family protein [Salinibacillus aidingensis]|uniref:site-2 protease family protein n=1 Tax=Salinibacillus aidingensis TaxID=237684 RepID=UPI0031DAA4F0